MIAQSAGARACCTCGTTNKPLAKPPPVRTDDGYAQLDLRGLGRAAAEEKVRAHLALRSAGPTHTSEEGMSEARRAARETELASPLRAGG